MVDIIVNNEKLELRQKGAEVKYSMQIGDIFDIASVKASYTNSFTIPKTAYNTQVFKFLGIVGDTSRIPYERVPATLTDNGFPIIKSGWLDVKETTTDYKISIIDGIIDFFKAIDNKTIGKDLDITELNHRKDLDTVIASFSNPIYKYIVADYNGKTLSKATDSTPGFNIDYLVPSVSIPYLWDKIFNTFGFTYSGSIFDNEDFSDVWLSYPKAPESEDIVDPILIASMEKYNFVELGEAYNQFADNKTWSSSTITEGSLIDNWSYQVPSTGNYRIRVRPKGYTRITIFTGINPQRPFYFRIMRGSTILKEIATTSEEEVDEFWDGYLSEGDVITFQIWPPIDESYIFVTLYHENTKVDIYDLSFGDVSFTEALSDFGIKDFIKEIVWRYGLTPVIDVNTNNIHFYTLEERLNVDNYIDWSSKYVGRQKEIYEQSGYAQVNMFKHKYNDAEETFNDGNLYVNNLNLEDNKAIATSKTYSYDNRISRIIFYDVFVYPIWQPEPKEITNDDGSTTIEVDYKGLTGRFYVMKHFINPTDAWFISDRLGGEQLADNYPVVKSDMTTFNDLLPKYYPELERVLQDFRCHTIELALGISDIINLSFIKLYYFSQEANYYMLNKITWQSGKTCIGEFIRVKKQ